jgi:hypothetical protein
MPDAVGTETTAPAGTGPPPSSATASSGPRHGAPMLTLNSDGQSHPVLNGLSAGIFVAGIAAFALGLVVSVHLVATVLGIVSLAGGMGTQLYSATREQRILIVTGIIGGFVGMALGIGHGGFS